MVAYTLPSMKKEGQKLKVTLDHRASLRIVTDTETLSKQQRHTHNKYKAIDVGKTMVLQAPAKGQQMTGVLIILGGGRGCRRWDWRATGILTS